MFVRPVTIRLHQTDAYGIIFYANLHKICHDVFQDWLESVGLPLPPDRRGDQMIAVVVHAEADFQASIRVGDHLEVGLAVEHIGTTSFTNRFILTDAQGRMVASARTVQVIVDPQHGSKVVVPARWREALHGNLVAHPAEGR